MSPANGHAISSSVNADTPGAHPRFRNVEHEVTPNPDQIKRYTEQLEVPFDPHVIVWRVTNTNRDKSRGQVIPYADQRAYTDRLNALFTPGGWTRRYKIHTSANFQRSKDQKIVAKVLVACELTIFGIGSHSATGEEWADDENAGTSAEAQAFKRACSCFGLGRYLYYFEGIWVDLDQRRQPRTVPSLPEWATPPGWARGLRPTKSLHSSPDSAAHSYSNSLVPDIEAMAEILGRGLYRGLLRDLAKVWSPCEIRDFSIQRRVLEHMRAAERGLRRLETAIEKAGQDSLFRILKSHQVSNLERVDNLETLKRIVLDLERVADSNS